MHQSFGGMLFWSLDELGRDDSEIDREHTDRLGLATLLSGRWIDDPEEP
jgi:hypothetical protein